MCSICCILDTMFSLNVLHQVEDFHVRLSERYTGASGPFIYICVRTCMIVASFLQIGIWPCLEGVAYTSLALTSYMNQR